MSRIVRNFWLDIQVDGRSTRIGTGPRSSSGGLSIDLGQRESKGIGRSRIEITCWASRGVLTTKIIERPSGEIIYELQTLRESADIVLEETKRAKKSEVERRHALEALANLKLHAEALTVGDIQEAMHAMLADKL